MPLVLIALGGAAGAISRYLIDTWISDRAGGAFPWGTLVINLSGSLVLGLLFALAIERDVLPASVRGPLMIGFIGELRPTCSVARDCPRRLRGNSSRSSTVAGRGAIRITR